MTCTDLESNEQDDIQRSLYFGMAESCRLGSAIELKDCSPWI